MALLGTRKPPPLEAPVNPGRHGRRREPRLLGAGHLDLAPSDDLSVAVAQMGAADLGEEGSAMRDRIIDFAASHPDLALRTCRPGHLTGSALVVDPSRGRTLLMLHAKLGRWFQPGGHADGDANLAAVALREATEETGIWDLRVMVPAIDIDIHEVHPPAEDPHLHLDLRFVVLAPPGAVETPNEESRALAWVGPEDLDGLDPPLDPGTRRLIRLGLEVSRSVG